MDWNYSREESERQSAIVGKHRVVITDAYETVTGEKSKNPGTPMIVVKLRPSGRSFSLTYRIQKNDWFNRKMTEFFDSFKEIPEGNFEFIEWVGCEGAAMLKEGNSGYTEVAYLIDTVKAADLPPFEGKKPERQKVTSIAETEDEEDLPFDV